MDSSCIACMLLIKSKNVGHGFISAVDLYIYIKILENRFRSNFSSPSDAQNEKHFLNIRSIKWNGFPVLSRDLSENKLQHENKACGS